MPVKALIRREDRVVYDFEIEADLTEYETYADFETAVINELLGNLCCRDVPVTESGIVVFPEGCPKSVLSAAMWNAQRLSQQGLQLYHAYMTVSVDRDAEEIL